MARFPLEALSEEEKQTLIKSFRETSLIAPYEPGILRRTELANKQMRARELKEARATIRAHKQMLAARKRRAEAKKAGKAGKG